MNKTKKVLLIAGAIVIAILVCLIITYNVLLNPVSKNYESVTFVVKKGEGKQEIIDNLKESNLIKSKYVTLFYILLNGNKNIQAGSYDFSRNMSTKEIIESLNKGDVIMKKRDSVRITFVEGITLKKYLELVAENTNLEYDVIIKDINNETFLKELINNYWFLTDDILDKDIYYALEGYLFPNTYEFYKNTSLREVITKMLDETKKRLEPLQDKIKNSGYSVHEILTIASIAEKEANSKSDRRKVAQVVYKRLELNMSLGMDVTSYYGAGKDMKEKLTLADLNDNNPYNTRLVTFLGLPVGPICNPSIESIEAALDPADTNYIYFFADVKTGKVYFTDNLEEFEQFKKIYG